MISTANHKRFPIWPEDNSMWGDEGGPLFAHATKQVTYGIKIAGSHE
ncbi:hypothetical protein J41TS4_31000 [Paenibacillus apis]|uniref:Uncharacterized protein n=1 Tax=Paenibacillus apis TaxID=1792174 RepID=A0A919Y777_9BACL|nr:hypothetical protein J41TS4_31000 [Paenibacillus apis]